MDVKDKMHSGQPMIKKSMKFLQKFKEIDTSILNRLLRNWIFNTKTVFNHLNRAGYEKNTRSLDTQWFDQ